MLLMVYASALNHHIISKRGCMAALLSITCLALPIWQGEDVEQYERLKEHALSTQKNIPDFIKWIIEKELKKCT